MAPGVIFLVEKLVGIAVSRMATLYIVEVNLLPSKVLTKTNSKSVWCSLCCFQIISYFMIEFYIQCSVSTQTVWALCFSSSSEDKVYNVGVSIYIW